MTIETRPTQAATNADGHELPEHLLGIWPHPDDEAYLTAGLMGRMIEAGKKVTILTLTRGEKGTGDPADHDQPHFAARREGELRASLATLGVADVRFGPYRDGECRLAHRNEAIALVARTIACLRPDAIVTFGPDGITGHEDHRLVSEWVTEAWRRVGGCDLFYATMGDDFIETNAGMHEELGIFGEYGHDVPAHHPSDEMAFEIRLDAGELDRKRHALAQHASQTTGLAELMGEETYRRWWRTESFRRPTAEERWCCTWRPAAGPVEPAVDAGVDLASRDCDDPALVAA